MTKTTKRRRKGKRLFVPKRFRLTASKGVLTPYQKLLGIPRPTIKVTEGDITWHTIPLAHPSVNALDKPKKDGCCIVAPRPPIRYPATWWDAVKARFVPTWVYGWGITEPTFIVHEL